jgi:hypothetical protein
MSDVISKAVEALSARLADGFDGSAKFVITGEGLMAAVCMPGTVTPMSR